MKRLLAAAIFVWAGIETSGANFCRPESIHYPEPTRYFQAPSDTWISPETVFAVIATAIVFFILGKVSSAPPAGVDRQAVLDAMNEAFTGRKKEADTHTKPKLEKPLEAARKAALKALEKLGLINPGWT